jgi:cell division protein FtsZ
MHEINQAAETITAAADPEANIIFGATISPDLEGEIIITVVATGFDDAYYANRSNPKAVASSTNSLSAPSKHDDQDITDIDMDLHDDEEAEMANNTPMPNIWTLDDKDEVQPDDEDNDVTTGNPVMGSLGDEDELEKPSFLRRLTKRRQQQSDKKTDDSSDDDQKTDE